jgi:hypothetical protein
MKVGNRIENLLKTVRQDDGDMQVSKKDLRKAVEYFNTWGERIDDDEVRHLYESGDKDAQRALHAFFTADEEPEGDDFDNSHNLNILRLLLTGELGVEVDPEAKQTVNDLLRMLSGY